MIICVCQNISDQQINDHLGCGKTKNEIFCDLQIGIKCGKCISYAIKHIDKLIENKGR